MNKTFKTHLFNKGYLVHEHAAEPGEAFATVVALEDKLGIKVTKGQELATQDMVKFVSQILGINVPKAFYRGFPQSVLTLSLDELLVDQLLHYVLSYGLGVDEAGHSVFEQYEERRPFRENWEPKPFQIVDQEEAQALLAAQIDSVLATSRPLSEEEYGFVLQFVRTYDYVPSGVPSKDLATKLLLDTRDLRFGRFLQLSDAIRLADEMNHRAFAAAQDETSIARARVSAQRKAAVSCLRADGIAVETRKEWQDNVRHISLRNQDRKLLAALIDSFFADEGGRGRNIRACYEKKRAWCGLLHHIHWKPQNEAAQDFARRMRTKGNESVWSAFDALMRDGKTVDAAALLVREKGDGALIRNLDYLLSLCKPEEVDGVIALLGTRNRLLLLQLYMRYALDNGESQGARDFAFVRHNKVVHHKETPEECAHRQSYVSDEVRESAFQAVVRKLEEAYHGSLGKVWIGPEMDRIALPTREASSQSGYGTLPTGSRLPILAGKKVRAFTYWEKVKDIDLSCVLVDEWGAKLETFYWGNMSRQQSDAITFSGDQVNGYHGGSEYYDVDIDAFRQKYPRGRFLVFTDNVYNAKHFSKLTCRAGYMLRDVDDVGQVFEPKTVRTSFAITCESTQAYLFALDLKERELIWLNMALDSTAAVSVDAPFDWLVRYLKPTQVMSMDRFFRMLATQVVSDPAEADVIVSQTVEPAEGQELIRGEDAERIMELMQ